MPDRAPRFVVSEPVQPERSLIEDLIVSFNGAKAPLVICGPAFCTPAGRDLMRRVSQRLGVPVIGMESPRGVNDPGLGAFSDILSRVDLLALIAKPLDYTLKFGGAPISAAAKWVVVDPDPILIARAHGALRDRLQMSAVADAGAVLEGLAGLRDGSGNLEWLRQVERALVYRPPGWTEPRASHVGRLHPLEMCGAIADFVEKYPGATFITDGGEISQWAQALVRTDRRIINGVAGAIGPAIPSAIAAKLHAPDQPVIVAMGDGTFGFHMAEFDTALRYDLPIIVVVGNDARWNAEYQIQLREFGQDRAKHCDLLPTRYDLVVEGLGGFGVLVTEAKDLPIGIERAYRSGKPACVNVMIEGVAAPQVRNAQM